ncbi:MAG: hypothetical protein Q8K55_04620, partial [Gemmatimonadaceae bacterium]|nr:hypothetical protein [Gemmatimonadaceae bacterium]
PDDHPLARPPCIRFCPADSTLEALTIARVRALRSENVRTVGVIVLAEVYLGLLKQALAAASLPLHVLSERGTRMPIDQPVVALATADSVGGQEFDAVVIVGLELGVFPPNTRGDQTLQEAVEQQAWRATYLATSRARYRVEYLVNKRTNLAEMLQKARAAGLLNLAN